MRQVRWIAATVLVLGACSNPAAPRADEDMDCSNSRRPCNQVLTEDPERAGLPYLADPNTIVEGSTVIRR